MKVVFRADASINIGTGHVMRCLTLAGLLKELDTEVMFICREHTGHLCDFIAKLGFPVINIPVIDTGVRPTDVNPLRHAAWLGASQEADAYASMQALKQIDKANWLIVDHYALDWRWESLLKTYAAKIMAIDDLADRIHDCEILLDQNLHKDMEFRYLHLVPGKCRQLLGPRYALLRPEFIVARQKLIARDGKVKRILVFMGGADAGNTTSMVLDALQLLNRPNIHVDVVLGGSNPYAEAIMQRCSELANMSCHIQVSNLAELMLKADFAIGAGGATAWERCALGLPSIAIAIAENQTAIAKEVANRGAAFFAGELKNIDKHRLAALLRDKLEASDELTAMSRRACKLVDANGTQRVAQQMLSA
jgi:UDP-2,4-diacetamido-2,4,6-trideoxy-beta-L-altropyranose hydrolase